MNGLPELWAQQGPPLELSDAERVALLALRRWLSGLTLSPPEAVPRPYGGWAWLLGWLGLGVLVLVAQGPRRALGQVFDLAGHVRLLAAAVGRLRQAGRLVVVVLGATVLAWTVSQMPSFAQADRLKDLNALRKSRSLGELAFEQGVLAGLVPLRDVVGLGDNLPLLVVAVVLTWRAATGGSPSPASSASAPRSNSSSWVGREVFVGLGVLLYAIERLIVVLSVSDGLPPGGCLVVDAVAVPLLMLLADGLLLSWALVELREADLGLGGGPLDVSRVLRLLPGAALACLAALPARYLATAAWLLFLNIPPALAGKIYLTTLLRGWGLIGLQGGALALVGLAGAAAWRGESGRATVRGYVRLIRAEGGRLAVVLGLGGLVAAGAAATAYALILSLPAQPWVLAAADSYAHYVTLPVGLTILAALVELGHRALGPPLTPVPPGGSAPDLVEESRAGDPPGEPTGTRLP